MSSKSKPSSPSLSLLSPLSSSVLPHNPRSIPTHMRTEGISDTNYAQKRRQLVELVNQLRACVLYFLVSAESSSSSQTLTRPPTHDTPSIYISRPHHTAFQPLPSPVPNLPSCHRFPLLSKSCGASTEVDLPRIAVAGKQSSGKSSIVETISVRSFLISPSSYPAHATLSTFRVSAFLVAPVPAPVPRPR